MNKRIIINADDFGLCDGVNQAVTQAYTDGVLTSATIMANMPAAEDAARIAKKLPALGVGVHLNLTEGTPLSKEAFVSRLIRPDGQFAHSAVKLAFLSAVEHKSRLAIANELAAQIQWVIDSGIVPTHLDSHKHIHSFPVIFPIVCRLAERFGIRAVRFAFEPKALTRLPWPRSDRESRRRAKIVRRMARINRVQDRRFLKTDAFFGITHTGKIDTDFFRAVVLYGSAETVEVMTHPGLTEGLDSEKTRLLQQRKLELDALCSDKTRQCLRDAGVKLVHYGNL